MMRGDHLGNTTDHVLLVQRGHDVVLKIRRNKESAVHIRAGGEHVVKQGLAAQVTTEVLLIRIRCSAGLPVHLCRLFGSSGQGCAHGLVEFGLVRVAALHTLDLVGQGVEFRFHLGIGRVVLCGQHAHIVSVGIEKTFHGVPQSGSLVAKFSNVHEKNPPVTVVFCRVQPSGPVRSVRQVSAPVRPLPLRRSC